jgi:hypothetical protein
MRAEIHRRDPCSMHKLLACLGATPRVSELSAASNELRLTNTFSALYIRSN